MTIESDTRQGGSEAYADLWVRRVGPPQMAGPRLPTITLTSRKIAVGIGVLLLFALLRNLPWEPFRTFSSLR